MSTVQKMQLFGCKTQWAADKKVTLSEVSIQRPALNKLEEKKDTCGESTQKTFVQCGQAVKKDVLGCRMRGREGNTENTVLILHVSFRT